jgi:molybdopterin synthase sulfur carrier subunit
MKIRVRYFASIREAIGRADEVVDTPALTLAELRSELLARGDAYALGLARGRALRMALNQVMASDHALLTEGAEVAFFPPVTGG